VHYLEKHGCPRDFAPVLEGVPFEVDKHVGDAACSRVIFFHESGSATLGHF
jgi:hypothetical protein